MRHLTLFVFILLCFVACKTTSDNLKEKAKEEIAQTEKDFEKMTAEKGIKDAFTFYADSNVVVKGQNDSLIKGRDGISNLYGLPSFKNVSLKWSPDFIDASEDGTLGYSYGKYVWQSKDSTGKLNEFKGVFHTVWKRQNDGSWKYVWD